MNLKELLEDIFYEIAMGAYETYQKQGGTVLSLQEFMDFHKKKISPWHLAKKEKEFKAKFKRAKDVIKKKLQQYFLKRKAA